MHLLFLLFFVEKKGWQQLIELLTNAECDDYTKKKLKTSKKTFNSE